MALTETSAGGVKSGGMLFKKNCLHVLKLLSTTSLKVKTHTEESIRRKASCLMMNLYNSLFACREEVNALLYIVEGDGRESHDYSLSS